MVESPPGWGGHCRGLECACEELLLRGTWHRGDKGAAVVHPESPAGCQQRAPASLPRPSWSPAWSAVRRSPPRGLQPSVKE